MFQYAATNDIIVIVPQAKIDIFPNSGECFDAIGKYQWDLGSTKVHPQYRALKRMFDRVAAPHGSVTTDLNANNLNEKTLAEIQANEYVWWTIESWPQILTFKLFFGF